MDLSVKNMLSYWRHSLADSLLGKGAFSEIELSASGSIRAEAFEFQEGRLKNPGDLFRSTAPKEGKGEKKDDFIKISIRPVVLRKNPGHAHGMRVGSSIPDLLMPISLTAWLGADGRLFAASRPVIARDVMDPLIQERGFVVTSIDNFDEFTDRTPFTGREAPPSLGVVESGVETWQDVVQYVSSLAKLLDVSEDHYVRTEHIYCGVCDSVTIATKKVVGLYDKLIADAPDVPLLSTLIERNISEVKPIECSESTTTLEIRLGHSDPKFPLAKAQRDAVSNFLLLKDKPEVLAVNGPPGTGKTTLLQSLLACLMVQRALSESPPPIVFACSANNQAVTNIIDAFGKVPDRTGDPLGGRWVPEISTLGVYHPSRAKLQEAIDRKYFISEQLNALELDGEYLARAESFYLERASLALGCGIFSSIREVRGHIVDRMRHLVKQIESVVSAYSAREQLMESCANFFCDASQKNQEYAAANTRLSNLARHKLAWDNSLSSWEELILNESFLERIFSFLPFVQERFRLKAKKALNPYSDLIGAKININRLSVNQASREAVTQSLEQGIVAIVTKIKKEKAWAKDALSLIQGEIEANDRLAVCLEDCFGGYPDAKGAMSKSALDIESFDNALDTTLRHALFRLSIHYYEGGWIEECRTLGVDPDKKTKSKQLRKARRQAMIAPCNVSTFFMVPDLFSAYSNGSSIPAYNLADLLIVDEAGQVTPEVAGATFALGKQALVVGDIWQIEPVWSAQKAADNGNLVSCGVAPYSSDADDLEGCHNRGYSASAGSVMKMAQNASAFHYNRKVERGMYLNEHRRCARQIIDYCNDLCYHGVLLPMTKEVADPLYPRLGYMDILGRCSIENGSRVNYFEAAAIASWISTESDSMMARYEEPIEKIIAIITPFKAQSDAIKRALAQRDSGLSKITVGTVHSLQGAERPVIIFSPTYDTQAGGGFFFDRGVNMMNVAVSRAKDSFLIFGSISNFNPYSSTPSGLFARHLDRAGNEQISLPQIDDLMRKALRKSRIEPPLSLFNAKEHDAFLGECLDGAKKNVSIVSPWISSFVVSKFIDQFKAAVSRGVDVVVLFDKLKLTKKEDLDAVDKLSNIGVRVVPLIKVHSKLLNRDDKIVTTGSFNWLSAQRDDIGHGKPQFEHTVVYDEDRMGREEMEFYLATLRGEMSRWMKQVKN